MGFPQSIRELEGLNKLLDELDEEERDDLEREVQRRRQEQKPPTPDEPADRRRAVDAMTPQVKIAFDHLMYELYKQVFAQPHRGGNGEERALLEAMWARQTQFLVAAVESETPDEMLAALIADGTLPADYAWPADVARWFR